MLSVKIIVFLPYTLVKMLEIYIFSQLLSQKTGENKQQKRGEKTNKILLIL